jgi:hypothetical protein
MPLLVKVSNDSSKELASVATTLSELIRRKTALDTATFELDVTFRDLGSIFRDTSFHTERL